MLFRLLLALAMTPFGQDVLTDLYKKYVRNSSRNYTRKDYRR